jgi:hypothetical protein
VLTTKVVPNVPISFGELLRIFLKSPTIFLSLESIFVLMESELENSKIH